MDNIYRKWCAILCFLGRHNIMADLPNEDGYRLGKCVNCKRRFTQAFSPPNTIGRWIKGG